MANSNPFHSRTQRRLTFALAATLVLLLLPAVASAQPPALEPGEDFFLSPYTELIRLIDGWKVTLLSYAQRLFIFLATIELIWTLYDTLLRRELGLEAGLYVFAKRLFVLLLLFNLLLWAPGIGSSQGAGVILSSFNVIGQDAGGHLGVRPSALLFKGFELGFQMLKKLGLFLLFLPLGGFKLYLVWFAVAVVFASYFLIAIYATFLILEAVVVVAVGFFMLAFTGSQFTIGLAQSYPSWLIRTGIKLMVLHLLIGLGWILTNDWIQQVQAFSLFEIRGYLVIAATAALYALIVLRFPVKAAALFPGGDAFNFRILFRE